MKEAEDRRVEVHVVICPGTGTPAVIECRCSPRPGGRSVDVTWCSRYPGQRFHCSQDCVIQVVEAEEDLL